jgi:hypothetical protein
MNLFSPVRLTYRIARWIGAEAIDWVTPERPDETTEHVAYIHGAPDIIRPATPLTSPAATRGASPVAPQIDSDEANRLHFHAKSDHELVEKERDLLTTRAGGRRQRDQTAGIEAMAIAEAQVSRRRNI